MKRHQGRVVRAMARLAMLALVSAAIIPASSRADTGSVEIVIRKAGFIMGAGGGRGTLTLRGRSYPLSITGISVGVTIGASKTKFTGQALHLQEPSDIAGTYTAASAGGALVTGTGIVVLVNAKGVVLELKGPKVGFEFSASVSGVEIRLR
jgi:hypothetical protein